MTENDEAIKIIISLLKGIQGLLPLTPIQGALTQEWDLAIKYLKDRTNKTWEELYNERL